MQFWNNVKSKYLKMKMLFKIGANIETMGPINGSPLTAAAYRGNLPLVKWLRWPCTTLLYNYETVWIDKYDLDYILATSI